MLSGRVKRPDSGFRQERFRLFEMKKVRAFEIIGVTRKMPLA